MPTQSDRISVLPTPVLLSRKQAAQVLSINIDTLDRLVRAGKISAKKMGRLVKFDAAELQRFANELPAWEPSA